MAVDTKHYLLWCWLCWAGGSPFKKVLDYSLPSLTETCLLVVTLSLVEPLHHRLLLPCRMLPSSFWAPRVRWSMWCCMMHVNVIHIVKRCCCLPMECSVDVCFRTSWSWGHPCILRGSPKAMQSGPTATIVLTKILKFNPDCKHIEHAFSNCELRHRSQCFGCWPQQAGWLTCLF